jgi:hypothetical protein
VSARRWWIGSLLAAALIAGATGVASAQTVVARIGGQLLARQGQSIDVPVTVDLSGAPGVSLGSYRGAIRFDPSMLEAGSVLPGTFAAPLVNTDSSAYGVVRFTAILPAGAPGPVVTLFIVRFYMPNPDTASASLTLSFDEMSAAGMPFTNLLPFLQPIQPATVCPSLGFWGDVDLDGNTNSRDALIALSRVVGVALDTTYTDPTYNVTYVIMRPGLADVDGDGRVTSRDALIIMSYAVGLPVSGYRIGRAAAGGVCAAGTGVVLRITPDTLELQSAQTFDLTVTARDSAGTPVTASDVRWSSSNPAVASATRDYSGAYRVAARDSGWAVISAEIGVGYRASAVVHVIARRSQWYVDMVRAGQTAYEQQAGDRRLPFAYIQDALNAARDLDTINVAAGVYPEAVSSDISVFLRGDSLNRPVIDPRGAGSYWGGPALSLGSRVGTLQIENFHVKGGGIEAYSHTFVGRNLRVDSIVSGEYSSYASIRFSSALSMPSGGAPPSGLQLGPMPYDTGSVYLEGIDVRGFKNRGIWIQVADSVVIQHATVEGDTINPYYCTYPGPGDFGAIVVDEASYTRVASNAVTDARCIGIGVHQTTGQAVVSGNRVTRAGVVGILVSAPQVALDHNAVRDVQGLNWSGTWSAGIRVSNARQVQSVTSLADTIRHVGAAGFLVDTAVTGVVDSLVVDSVGITLVENSFGVALNGGRYAVRTSRISNTESNALNVCGPTAVLFSRGNRITRPGYNGISTWDCYSGNGPDTLVSVADTVVGTYANTGTGIRAAGALYARVDSAVVSGLGTDTAMGIGFSSVGNAMLRDSKVSNLGSDGVYVYGGAGALLERDSMISVSSGLWLDGTGDTTRVRQTVVMNSTSSGIGVRNGAVIRADTIVVTGSGSNSSGLSFNYNSGGRITGSRLERNSYVGVHAHSTNGVDASLILRNNSLASNDSGGVRSMITPVDAKFNWWGQASGPHLDTAAVDSFSVVGVVNFDSVLTARPTFPLAPPAQLARAASPAAPAARDAEGSAEMRRPGRGARDIGPSAVAPTPTPTPPTTAPAPTRPLLSYRKGAPPRPATVHHP